MLLDISLFLETHHHILLFVKTTINALCVVFCMGISICIRHETRNNKLAVSIVDSDSDSELFIRHCLPSNIIAQI